jgi:hypothetical protein
MRFEVFMAVTIMMMFFWVWALCGLDGKAHMVPKPRGTSSLIQFVVYFFVQLFCTLYQLPSYHMRFSRTAINDE